MPRCILGGHGRLAIWSSHSARTLEICDALGPGHDSPPRAVQRDRRRAVRMKRGVRVHESPPSPSFAPSALGCVVNKPTGRQVVSWSFWSDISQARSQQNVSRCNSRLQAGHIGEKSNTRLPKAPIELDTVRPTDTPDRCVCACVHRSACWDCSSS